MIIWSGKGILSVLVLLLALVLTISIAPEGQGTISLATALFIAAAFSWYFGKKWNGQSKTVVDKETGQEIELKQSHSLFWINIQYWGVLYAIIGILVLLTAFV